MSEWTAERIARTRKGFRCHHDGVDDCDFMLALDEIERCHAALSTTTEQLVALSRIHQADKARIAELEAAEVELAVTKRALELACLFVTVADHGDTKNYNEWLAYFTRQAEQG